MLVRPPHKLRFEPVATFAVVFIHSQVQLHGQICGAKQGASASISKSLSLIKDEYRIKEIFRSIPMVWKLSATN